MKNYDSIWYALFKHQNQVCSGCGKPIAFFIKTDLAHWLANTKTNAKSYPLFINSLLNISLQNNECNVGRKQPLFKQHGCRGKGRCTHYIAERYEAFLRRHPAIARWCNDPVGKLWEGK